MSIQNQALDLYLEYIFQSIPVLKRDYELLPDPDICLVNQGIVCLGSATRSGCGSQCPNANAPCLGCYGPTVNVHDQGAKSLMMITSIAEEAPEVVASKLLDPAGLFNRFTLPSATIGAHIDDNGEGK